MRFQHFSRAAARRARLKPDITAGKEEKERGIPLRSVCQRRKIREIRRYYGKLSRDKTVRKTMPRRGKGGNAKVRSDLISPAR